LSAKGKRDGGQEGRIDSIPQNLAKRPEGHILKYRKGARKPI